MKSKVIIPALILALLATTPSEVDAAEKLVACTGLDCDFCLLAATVSNVVNWLTIIAALIAGLALMYGGFFMVTSSGNENRYAKGKQIFFNAVIGVILVFSAWSLINVLLATLAPGNSVGSFAGIECGESGSTDTNLQQIEVGATNDGGGGTVTQAEGMGDSLGVGTGSQSSGGGQAVFTINEPADPGAGLEAGPNHGQQIRLAPDQSDAPPGMRRVENLDTGDRTTIGCRLISPTPPGC